MRTTFFDFIGAADMERIHSATIAWMISDKCEAFNLEDRIFLLNTLFGTTLTNIKSITVCNEFNRIDIAFITTHLNGGKEFWAVENKVKAPLGNNQLKNYEDITSCTPKWNGTRRKKKKKIERNDEKNSELNYQDCHFAVLSLIGVLPQDHYGDWHIVEYSEFLKALQRICNKINYENQHLVIIHEYRDCLSNFVIALSQFRKHPEEFPFVFTEGNKKKSAKLYISDSSLNNYTIGEYISNNGLETLLQKDYFATLLKEIYQDFDEINSMVDHCHVTETHGNADFAFHFRNPGIEMEFDLSFQNGTFKFAGTKKNYPKVGINEKKKFLIEWEDVFLSIVKSDIFSDYNKLNRPKSRARISVSYTLGDKWYEIDRNEFIKIVRNQISIAYNMMKYVIGQKYTSV